MVTRYFARYDADGNLTALGKVGTSDELAANVEEITKEEYEALLEALPEPEVVPVVDEVEECLEILRGEAE